ncbi:MAG: lysylphosphatidylglycerol synthase transmembrane domain-containing protein [Anaerolineae bacterium]
MKERTNLPPPLPSRNGEGEQACVTVSPPRVREGLGEKSLRFRPLDILKMAISLALIAYLLWRVKPAAVLAAMRGANYGLLLLALALYFGAIALGVLKWATLLAAQGERVPCGDLFSFTFTGLFFGNFLPTNVGGDLVRGYDLARHLCRAEDAAISVLVDRLVGLIAFITSGAVMAALAVYSWRRTDLLPLAAIVWLACLAALVGLAVLLSRHLRLLIGRLFAWRPLARLQPVYERLSGALQTYRERPGALARAYAIGMGVILASNLVNYLVAVAVHAGIPLAYVFLFNPMIAFAPLIVPSLGGLGVNQGAYDLLYASVGGLTTRPAALTVSLLMQLLIYLSSLPGGILWLRGRRIKREERAASSPPPPSFPEAHP